MSNLFSWLTSADKTNVVTVTYKKGHGEKKCIRNVLYELQQQLQQQQESTRVSWCEEELNGDQMHCKKKNRKENKTAKNIKGNVP